MKKVFGIKEANEAAKFATTSEQKRTVLAVVGMLGMTVKLGAEIKKKINELTAKAVKKHEKVNKLAKKVTVANRKINSINNDIDKIIDTEANWDV